MCLWTSGTLRHSLQHQPLHSRSVSAYKTTSSIIIHQLANVPLLTDYIQYQSIKFNSNKAKLFLEEKFRSYHQLSNDIFKTFFFINNTIIHYP